MYNSPVFFTIRLLPPEFVDIIFIQNLFFLYLLKQGRPAVIEPFLMRDSGYLALWLGL